MRSNTWLGVTLQGAYMTQSSNQATSNTEIVSPHFTIAQCQILGHLVDDELANAEANLSPHPVNALKTLLDVFFDIIQDSAASNKQKLALVQNG